MPRLLLGSLALCVLAVACGRPGSGGISADFLTERIEALLDA